MRLTGAIPSLRLGQRRCLALRVATSRLMLLWLGLRRPRKQVLAPHPRVLPVCTPA